MTPNPAFDKTLRGLRVLRGLFFLLLIAGCTSHKAPVVPLPAYSEFVAARQQAVPDAVLEIYGRYAVSQSGKTFRAGFNLLALPGKNAYLELLDAKGGLQYAVSLNPDQIGLLWGPEEQYILEPATVQNLNKISGFSLNPDDLLMLICGYGLDFSQWQADKTRSDGWNLVRDPFHADLQMGKELARVNIKGPGGDVQTQYEDYKLIDNRSIPQTIIFKVPSQKITLQLTIDKFLVRDEPPSADLFDLQLPKDARHLQLQDLYKGKPLLLQR